MTIAAIAVLSAWYLSVGAGVVALGNETNGRPAKLAMFIAWPVIIGLLGGLSVWSIFWERGEHRRIRRIVRARLGPRRSAPMIRGDWPPPPPRNRGRK